MAQLALPLRLADHAVFDSFLCAGNETLVATLEALADSGGAGCWIWGAPSSGKTHLLQAVCARAGDRSIYVPLRAFADKGAEVLEGLENRDLVCLDDLNVVAGSAVWETALFALCNGVEDRDGTLVIAAPMSSRECPVVLSDLQSRLARLASFRIRPLEDPQRVAALKLRARHRGLELPDETARYLLTRSRRDMASLYGLLDKLDRAALEAQRRLTIPFVKEVL